MKRSPIRSRSLKSLSVAEAMAQKAFNAYVRARDYGSPCISCGKMTELQAGHYRSVGSSPELRFEESNAHLQCVRCNRDLSGNAVAYRKRLLLKIGAEKLDWLEGPHAAKLYTIEDLKQIAASYRRKCKELKTAQEHVAC